MILKFFYLNTFAGDFVQKQVDFFVKTSQKSIEFFYMTEQQKYLPVEKIYSIIKPSKRFEN